VKPGKPLQIPIQLKVHAATQTLTVTEDSGPELSLDSGDTAGTTVMKNTDLDALPDNPDDLLNILQTLAGQVSGGAQILIDNFSGGQLPPKSAIKEIKINQDPFSA